MALSGTFKKDVYTSAGGHFRLRCVWTGSQSTSGNYTDITLKVYWESLKSQSAIYSSTSKNGSSTIDGTTSSFTFTAGLSGNQSKLVKTQTKRVYHNSEGKASISMSASLSINVTLVGTYTGTVTASSGTVTLNTIPRESTMTSSASFTAGTNRTITVKRFASSFTHRVHIDVMNSSGTYVNVKTINFSGTSVSTSFTQAEHTQIFTLLAGRASTSVRMNLHTLSGGTSIGYKTYTGTLSAPAASTAKVTNPTGVSSSAGQGNQTVWIDQTINLEITRANSGFTHTVRFYDGQSGSVIKTITGVGTSTSWTPTTTEQNKLYAKTPNAIEFDSKIEVDTFYNGVKVRSSVEMDLNFRVRNAEPIFTNSQVDYADINTTTTGMTGNNQLIVQGYSKFRAIVKSVATPQKGATIKSYVVTINGQSQSKTVSSTVNGTGNYDFSQPINASVNQVLSVKVTDSRGLSKTVTKTVTVIPYTEPTLAISAKRQNSFGEQVTLRTNGTFASVNGTNKIQTLQRRYKEKSSSSWSEWANISVTQAGGVFDGANILLVMDVTKAYDVEVKVADMLSSEIIRATSVAAGQPIFFIDSDKRSIGFNDFPTNPNEIRINGRIVFGSNTFVQNVGDDGAGGGALDMNNSDITRINGLWFNDNSTNGGEGILFIRNTATAGSTNANDYYTWRIDGNGRMQVNGQPMMDLETTGAVKKMYTKDLDVSSTLTVDSNSGLLKLVGKDHCYLEFYPQGVSNGRVGYIGYASAGSKTLTIRNNGALMTFGNDGTAMIQSSTIYNRTYSASANLYITGYGTIGRTTSASRYKTNVQPETDLEFSERILQLDVKSWVDKNEMYQKLMNDMGLGHFEEAPTGELRRHYGLIAEDVGDVGLSQFVQYGSDGQVEGLEYDRLWTLLIPIVRRQQERIEALEQHIRNSQGQ